MRAAAWVAIVVGCLLILAAFGAFTLCIWTVGPDSGRWAGTGVVLAIVGALSGVGGTVVLDATEPKR